MQLCRLSILIPGLFTISIGVASSIAEAATCLESTGKDATEVCQQELSRNPEDKKVRLHLADILVNIGRLREAETLVKRGLEFYPEDDELREKERIISDKIFYEAGSSDTEFKLNKLRCKTLRKERALQACEAGLEKRPYDTELLIWKADALLDMDRARDAVETYQTALELEPANTGIVNKLKTAEEKRQMLVTRCRSMSGRTALAACNDALLRGARDHAIIENRRGDLLLSMGNIEAALKAYRTVRGLDPGNSHAGNAIAKLTAPAPKVAIVKDTTQKDASRKQAEIEAARKQAEAETAQKLAEAEAARKQAEAEAARIKAEAEAAQKLAEAEAARKQAEAEAEEAARKKAEAEAARKQAEAEAAEAARRKTEAEAAQKKAEAEAEVAARKKAESEAARAKAEAEAEAAWKKAKAEAEVAARKKAEAEAARKMAEAEAEDAARRKAEAEAARKRAEADAARKKAEAEAAEATRKRSEAEAARKKAEAESEEAARKKAEAEAAREKARGKRQYSNVPLSEDGEITF